MTNPIIDRLLESPEPSVRFRILTRVLGRKADSPEVRRVQTAIRNSERAQKLLSERDGSGRIPYHPYAKWYGAHWVLASLADLGYPAGDRGLIPLREQVYEWLLSPAHQQHIRTIAGRVRRCASQEGNALYSLLSLGLADERAEELARRLRKWQWPDGGWNCDKTPAAVHSSFMETLLPMRALILHARRTGSRPSRQAAKRAAEVFLKRRLFLRQSNGRVIRSEFVLLHHPCYWHYDILSGLKVLAEAGWVKDARCARALDLLESKRLAGGGFPAEQKYYRVASRLGSGRLLVDWGGIGKTRANPFVTADAFYVLKAAGRRTQSREVG